MASSASNYECPVCLVIPLGKIFQCSNGHVICEECLLRMIEVQGDDLVCHTCRRLMNHSPIRNLWMEMNIRESIIPCKSRGCDIKLPLVMKLANPRMDLPNLP